MNSKRIIIEPGDFVFDNNHIMRVRDTDPPLITTHVREDGTDGLKLHFDGYRIEPIEDRRAPQPDALERTIHMVEDTIDQLKTVLAAPLHRGGENDRITPRVIDERERTGEATRISEEVPRSESGTSSRKEQDI